MHRRLLLLIIMALLASRCTTTSPDAADPRYSTLPERSSLDLPYSDAVRVGDLLFLSGTVGAAPGTRQLVEGGVTAETRQALENVKRNAEAHGSSLDDLVKCTVFLADIRDFEAMNSVYRTYFLGHKPARTTVGVAGLPLNARVEIECIGAAAAESPRPGAGTGSGP